MYRDIARLIWGGGFDGFKMVQDRNLVISSIYNPLDY